MFICWINNMKRAKIKFKNKNTGHVNIKTGSFYPLGIYFILKDNSKLELYQRNKQRYYKDIPLGQNQYGIIYNGYFIKLFESQLSTSDYYRHIKRIENLIAHKTIENIKSAINSF